jgi:hypothetical protein
METGQSTHNKVIQKEGFDEQTKLHFQSLLEEIDRKQQPSYQSTASDGKSKYIKFTSDKERKVLSFTDKVSKLELPAKEFETGRIIPDRYVTRYLFECYDITTIQNQETNGTPAIWERGTKDARTILYYLSKDIRALEIIRNGVPGSKSTTYLINPRLD